MDVNKFQETFKLLKTIVLDNGNLSIVDEGNYNLLSKLRDNGFNITHNSIDTIHVNKDNIDYVIAFDHEKMNWYVYETIWINILLPKGNKHYAKLSSDIKPHQNLLIHYFDDNDGFETIDINIDDNNVCV